jgi:hypothetical protein
MPRCYTGPVSKRQQVLTHKQGFGATLVYLKDGRNILGSPDLKWYGLEPELVRRCQKLAHFLCNDGVSSIA